MPIWWIFTDWCSSTASLLSLPATCMSTSGLTPWSQGTAASPDRPIDMSSTKNGSSRWWKESGGLMTALNLVIRQLVGLRLWLAIMRWIQASVYFRRVKNNLSTNTIDFPKKNHSNCLINLWSNSQTRRRLCNNCDCIENLWISFELWSFYERFIVINIKHIKICFSLQSDDICLKPSP